MKVIEYFPDLIQGTDEWMAARRGLLTASEMHLILTPTLKVASNDKERAHVNELLAQRISEFVEPSYIGDDMLRGLGDEIEARAKYAENYAPVSLMGFAVNTRHGVRIGCSPDGLIGADGMIEIKSRRQKHQVNTIVEHVLAQTIPAEYVIQVQTELLVLERKWCDFVSYCAGLPMATIRVFPDPVIQIAIIEAARAFEERLAEKLAIYRAVTAGADLIATTRTIEQEMYS